MLYRKLLSAGIALALVATPAGAACWQHDEYEAARVRDLQTMLMVSALQCRRQMPGMPAAYNRFVGRARTQLVDGERVLLAHFARESDRSSYDRFTTALANRYAELAQREAFCERAMRVLEADEATGGSLPMVVAMLNARPNGVGDICPAKVRNRVVLISPFDPIPVDGSPVRITGPAPTVPVNEMAQNQE
jgi:hypothetical protein